MNRAQSTLTACVVFAGLAAGLAAEPLPWSLAPVRRPTAPKVKDATWLKVGVDVFILARLEAAGVAPNPDADRRSHLTGTGFLALGAMELPLSGQESFALDRIDDQIDVTTRAFLGLTLSCARCHDHKTDPIKQRDYYALAGIFQSTETLSGGRRGAYVDPDLALRLPVASVAPVVQTAALEMDDRGLYRIDPNHAMGVTEGEVEDCAIRIKGEPNQRGDTPRRGEIAMPGLAKLPVIGAKESGRLQLAQWIASPSNPARPRSRTAHLPLRGP